MGEPKDKIKSAGFEILKTNFFGVFLYPGFCLVKRVNKYRFDRMSHDDKNRVVFAEIQGSSRSLFMEKVCNIEYFLGRWIKYPFGIRGYAVAQKPVQ
jgi:hypothetical protein